MITTDPSWGKLFLVLLVSLALTHCGEAYSEPNLMRYDLVAYTLVSDTGHPAKVVTMAKYPSAETCSQAAGEIARIIKYALHPVGFFCIER